VLCAEDPADLPLAAEENDWDSLPPWPRVKLPPPVLSLVIRLISLDRLATQERQA
jgi:hypothetical protein